MKVELTEAAMDDLHFWLRADCKVTQKILSLLEEPAQSPCSGRGRPEQLSHTLSGYWSRRINTKDRLIYRVDDETATMHIMALKCQYF